jgi:two-component system phosphate regulon sensor histidine kinase PhoR
MNKKLNISRWLMYVSVLLLLVFQAYWLRKVYHDSYRSLQREIAVVLREAFVKDQLQIIFGTGNVLPFRSDTLRANGRRVEVMMLKDSLVSKNPLDIQDRNFLKGDSVKFQLHIGEGRDSGRKMGGAPRFMAFDSDDEDAEIQSRLIITLPVSQSLYDSGVVNERYEKILDDAGLPSSFTISKSAKLLSGAIGRQRKTEPNWRDRRGVNMILADLDFGNTFPHIMRKMYGQVLIALFMTGTVILAFRFMFKSLKEHQKMAALKNDFISNMTHELKTPVATVSVAIEALKNFSVMDNPARTREYLDISTAELNRLTMLIDKVLRINMFEADKLEMDAAPISLNELTQEVLQAQQLQATQTGASITWTNPGEPIMVKGDKLHLMSVMYNLLDNAMKYRSAHPEIVVSLAKEGNDAVLKVKDNGPGIAAEYRNKVFEKFFRIPTGDRHDVKGYGLGLSYVHEVVQKHGGTIKVESEPGKGSTFIVKLPVAG